MTEPRTFTRGDLTTFRGVDHDALQFWFREALLVPEPAEPRKHRRFSEVEAKIAAILGEARAQGLNLAALRALAESVREALRFRGDILSRLGSAPTSNDEVEAIRKEEVQGQEKLMLAWAISDCDGVIGLRSDEDGSWKVRSIGDLIGMKSRSEMLFNLNQVLADFREQL